MIAAGKTFYLHGSALPIGDLLMLTDSPQIYVVTEVALNAYNDHVSTCVPYTPIPLTDERVWEWLDS